MVSTPPGPEPERISGDLDEPPDRTGSALAVADGPGTPHWGSALGLAESLDELADRFATLCANAVHPLEIVAGLEMDGMSDQTARISHGFPDVFALAEALFRRTSRRPAVPGAAVNPWRTTIGRPALHGLLFALPALCYPVASGFMADRRALSLLVVSMLVSWPAGQGLSYLGHARRGARDDDGSRWLLRAGLAVCCVLLAAAVVPVAAALGEPPVVPLFAGGQGGYLLAATVLLVGDGELWLYIALTPGVLASAAYLLLGSPAALRVPALLALGATLLLAVAFAVLRTSRPRPKPARRLVRIAELRAAAPYAVFGLLVIGLLLFPLVAPRLFAGMPGADAATMLGTLPLSLSMGVAELQLYRYRGRIFHLLHRSHRLAEFAGRSRLVFGRALGEYLVATAVLMAAVIGLSMTSGGHPRWSEAPGYAGYLALGGALFVALLTQACAGNTNTVLTLCAAALAAEFGYGTADPHASATHIQLLCATGLLLALAANAGTALARANRHGQ